MINIIFVLIFVIGLIYSIFSGRTSDVINVMLTSPKDAFFIFIDIYALLVFWGGVLEVCKESGLLKKITYFVTKAIHPLFKKIDINDEAMQFISMNFVANMLSMGSAATPFGLKAMKRLDEINNHMDVASYEMVTFLLINTSGLCLIPTTLISLRSQAGSGNPVIIIPYIIIISILTTIFAIVLDMVVRKNAKY